MPVARIPESERKVFVRLPASYDRQGLSGALFVGWQPAFLLDAWPVVASSRMSIGHQGIMRASKVLTAAAVDLLTDATRLESLRGGAAAEDEGRHVPLADSRRTTSRQVELPPLDGEHATARRRATRCPRTWQRLCSHHDYASASQCAY
jgi:hypothetical protein